MDKTLVIDDKKSNFVRMILATYINDLLYRYDCVIVPNFGGFITNKIGAVIEEETNTFYPPTKKIGFNANLKHNDGLLANYIASSENISFESANKFIDTTVYQWQTELAKGALQVDGVGSMSLNTEKQLIFEPNSNTNFLMESFGLASVQSAPQVKVVEQVIPIHTQEELEETNATGGIAGFIKYAATIAIVLSLGAVGMNQFNKVQEKNALVEQQEEMEQKIQEATFVIENPLPTINLSVAKEDTKEFHIIAGAFELEKNADKKLNQLLEKGFDARILGLNTWGLTQVAFESYETKEEASRALRKIKNSGFNHAWLLVKKFD